MPDVCAEQISLLMTHHALLVIARLYPPSIHRPLLSVSVQLDSSCSMECGSVLPVFTELQAAVYCVLLEVTVLLVFLKLQPALRALTVPLVLSLQLYVPWEAFVQTLLRSVNVLQAPFVLLDLQHKLHALKGFSVQTAL